MLMIGKCGTILNNKHCGHHGRGRILRVLLEKGTMTQSELQNIIDIRSRIFKRNFKQDRGKRINNKRKR